MGMRRFLISVRRLYDDMRRLYEIVRRLYQYNIVIFRLRRLYLQFLKTLYQASPSWVRQPYNLTLTDYFMEPKRLFTYDISQKIRGPDPLPPPCQPKSDIGLPPLPLVTKNQKPAAETLPPFVRNQILMCQFFSHLITLLKKRYAYENYLHKKRWLPLCWSPIVACAILQGRTQKVFRLCCMLLVLVLIKVLVLLLVVVVVIVLVYQGYCIMVVSSVNNFNLFIDTLFRTQEARVSLKAPIVMLKLLPPIFLFHLVQFFIFFF